MVRLVSGVDNDYIYVYAGCYYPNVDRADNCSSDLEYNGAHYVNRIILY